MQVALIHQSHVSSSIKISRTFFKKGHPRRNSVKLFQNLTIRFREEDFLRIPSFLYSASSPHSPEPHFLTDQNFTNSFLKRVTQGTYLWNYFTIRPAVSEEKIFKEFLHFCIVQEAPIHQSHNFWRIKISQTVFEKGHPRNISVKLFHNPTSGPARVAQWWACRTRDLVIVSSIPGWGDFSFRRIFASHLCRSMWEK